MLVSELLAGLAAKLAGLGLAAQAALGLGIATVAVTGAGAANVLPDPAQHAVASVVNAVSPLELPDPNLSENVDKATKGSVPGSLLADEDDLVDGDEGDDGGEAADNHGACVSAVAKNKAENTSGREHGLAVSTMAKSDCGKEDKSASTSSTSSTSTTSTTLETDSTASELEGGSKGKGRSGNDNSGPSENRGQGSNSGGNSGRGNSGR